jgi:hypothetical protein
MSFTDRFLAVPIKTYSVKHKELTGEEELEDGVMKFNPFEMSNYYSVPTRMTMTSDFTCTRIVLKNGDSTVVYLRMTEFEKLLNERF